MKFFAVAFITCVILTPRLSGHVPFHDDNPNTLENLICEGELKFSNPLWLDVHEAGNIMPYSNVEKF